jgi:predicted component of type VI protein secretion system
MKQLLITIAAVVLVGCDESPKDIWDAATSGNIEAVKQHLAAGTDVNAKNDDGKTPLDLTVGKFAAILRKHGGKTGEELKAEGK